MSEIVRLPGTVEGSKIWEATLMIYCFLLFLSSFLYQLVGAVVAGGFGQIS